MLSYIIKSCHDLSNRYPTNGFCQPTKTFMTPTNGFRQPTKTFMMPTNSFWKHHHIISNQLKITDIQEKLF